MVWFSQNTLQRSLRKGTFSFLQQLILLLTWLSGKESICQCRRHGFDPWVRKILWRRKWQPPPVFLLGKSHGEKSLVESQSLTWLDNQTTTILLHQCPNHRFFGKWLLASSVLGYTARSLVFHIYQINQTARNSSCILICQWNIETKRLILSSSTALIRSHRGTKFF